MRLVLFVSIGLFTQIQSARANEIENAASELTTVRSTIARTELTVQEWQEKQRSALELVSVIAAANDGIGEVSKAYARIVEKTESLARSLPTAVKSDVKDFNALSDWAEKYVPKLRTALSGDAIQRILTDYRQQDASYSTCLNSRSAMIADDMNRHSAAIPGLQNQLQAIHATLAARKSEIRNEPELRGVIDSFNSARFALQENMESTLKTVSDMRVRFASPPICGFWRSLESLIVLSQLLQEMSAVDGALADLSGPDILSAIENEQIALKIRSKARKFLLGTQGAFEAALTDAEIEKAASIAYHCEDMLNMYMYALKTSNSLSDAETSELDQAAKSVIETVRAKSDSQLTDVSDLRPLVRLRAERLRYRVHKLRNDSDDDELKQKVSDFVKANFGDLSGMINQPAAIATSAEAFAYDSKLTELQNLLER